MRLAQNGSVVQQTPGHVGMLVSEAFFTNCQTPLQQPFCFSVVFLGELQYGKFCEALCHVRMVGSQRAFSNLKATFAECPCLSQSSSQATERGQIVQALGNLRMVMSQQFLLYGEGLNMECFRLLILSP